MSCTCNVWGASPYLVIDFCWKASLQRHLLPQPTRGITPILFNFCASVEDGQPILKQHWMNVSCLNSIMIQSIFCCTGGCGIYSLGTDFISWSFVTNANWKSSRPRKSSKKSELRVQSGLFKGGDDLTNLDYIVQRCALFVLAKHVETVTARMIEMQ